jgi:dihydropyrimidine dehydrogenase (NAD+) subunit PreA
MPDLSVKFGGIEFRNPVWVASLSPSAPFTARREAVDIVLEKVKRCYNLGLGGYVTGSIWFEDPTYEWRGKGRNLSIKTRGFADREAMVGMGNMPDGAYPRTIGLELVKRIKKECPEMGLIASIYGHGDDPNVWGRLAEDAKQAGADMVEMNVCCFMVFDSISEGAGDVVKREEYPAGLMLGLVPEITAKLVSGMRAMTDIPIIVKITPELPMLRLIPAAAMYQQAGAVGVTCSHLFMTAPPPDIYNHGRPSIPYMDKVAFFGVVGPAIRYPGCYRNVAAVAKNSPGLDVAACGGLVTPEHTIEAMMLGAKSVQLSSGIVYNGFSFISQVIEFMKRYMKEQGFKNVGDFIGLGLNYIVEHGEFLQWWDAHPVVAKIDYLKCNKCGICMDNLCFATYWKNGWPKVDTKLCSSCNICVFRCPVGARSLVPVKVGGKMPEWQKRGD